MMDTVEAQAFAAIMGERCPERRSRDPPARARATNGRSQPNGKERLGVPVYREALPSGKCEGRPRSGGAFSLRALAGSKI
jgi:hypothetical protein